MLTEEGRITQYVTKTERPTRSGLSGHLSRLDRQSCRFTLSGGQGLSPLVRHALLDNHFTGSLVNITSNKMFESP